MAAAYANRSLPETANKPVTAFADGAEVPAWAQDVYRTALSARLLEGDDRNLLHPLEGTTRAEAVTVLLRLIR
ncbi:S-layer homology domain-containing protein [Paenibacillus tyrfis]|uniref:S-layer homology domain-containing protein n=1 Tax=Paenibacillus tyrfis TaxID=1501230 RepID=UPI00209F60DB|nr:S-layer homology domain-containing protein [Paenibacillus tyrfis]MCP1312511.1 S-layer homology domain-containing protein [Paenibacillus tyrfis]